MSKYQLQEPTQVTKERLLEVKFYLFMVSFLHKAGQYSAFKTDILGILANTYNLNTAALLSAVNTLEHPHYKPTMQEIIIANHIMGITVRTLSEQGIVSMGNYYKVLQNYIDQEEPTLLPKLTDNMREVIKNFFDATDGLFTYVSNIMKGEI